MLLPDLAASARVLYTTALRPLAPPTPACSANFPSALTQAKPFPPVSLRSLIFHPSGGPAPSLALTSTHLNPSGYSLYTGISLERSELCFSIALASSSSHFLVSLTARTKSYC